MGSTATEIQKQRQETSRECHETLHATAMQCGDDPGDFFYIMDGYRDRIDKKGLSAPDENTRVFLPGPFLPNVRGPIFLAARNGVMPR